MIERPKDESLLRITALRIVKDRQGFFGIPQMDYSADFYCRALTEPKYLYETEEEIVLYVEHLRLNDACLITAGFEKSPDWNIAAVLCEGERIPWQEEGGKYRFTFEISGFTGKTRTLFVHTLLREPGMTVRIEQNSQGRRAGLYRSNPYPTVQIQAASHYIFATQRILRKLGVPEHLSREGLGHMLLLSFETYNEVHGDWPPHWHLILRWPDHCASQAPHIYMDEQGRNTHNYMYIDMIPNVSYTYRSGQWCPYVDRYGRQVLRCRLEEDGGFSLTREGRSVYTVSPYREDGVTIAEDGAILGRLQVENDTAAGVMQIRWLPEEGKAVLDTVTYDPLTGKTKNWDMGQ